MQKTFTPNITVFHCINSFVESSIVPGDSGSRAEINFVKMPCSSMVKDVFLLRAFEADADAVIVLVCPKGQCRYVEGNLRAAKRTAWVRRLLDDIGLDGRRLSLHHVKTGSRSDVDGIIGAVVSDLQDLGPSPVQK